ncbi:hypothetical protein PM082_016244 [Marasmius tenuissimus]|nr:hypothetical protein PM082_016244 [Marasmius tenuissimus]
MSLKLQYFVYDVFTTTAFQGNPLAVVRVPATASITQTHKQTIAREFNFSETTFVHEDSESQAQSVFRTDIFTPYRELPFAGHPTIGTSFHLLSNRPNISDITLQIKAGDTPAVRSGYEGSVRLQVPVDFKVHAPLEVDQLLAHQTRLARDDLKDGHLTPIASIVKGMTFFLLELNSVDALGRMNAYPVGAVSVPSTHLGAWTPDPDNVRTNVYVYACTHLEEKNNDQSTTRIRTRMFSRGGFEDPGTGSAASTLAGYLALKKGKGQWRFQITQGVEMRRTCDIAVVVEIGDGDVVKSVQLEGNAVKIMEGVVQVTDL